MIRFKLPNAHLNIFGGRKLVIYDEHIVLRYLSNVSRLFHHLLFHQRQSRPLVGM